LGMVGGSSVADASPRRLDWTWSTGLPLADSRGAGSEAGVTQDLRQELSGGMCLGADLAAGVVDELQIGRCRTVGSDVAGEAVLGSSDVSGGAPEAAKTSCTQLLVSGCSHVGTKGAERHAERAAGGKADGVERAVTVAIHRQPPICPSSTPIQRDPPSRSPSPWQLVG
jgi:hypothetical protein